MANINQEKIARAITFLMSAPSVAIFTNYYIFQFGKSDARLFDFLGASFFSGILPILIIYAMKRKEMVEDMMVDDRGDRTMPFIAVIFGYSVGTILLYIFIAPLIMVYLMLCYAVNTSVMMLITFKWKISLHTAGVGGSSAFFVHQYGLSIIPFIGFALIVGWARHHLEKHTVWQLSAGLLLTASLTYLQFELYTNFILPL